MPPNYTDYIKSLRELERRLMRGGKVLDIAQEFETSHKTIRRQMRCLRDLGAVLVQVDKGVWVCRRGIFLESQDGG